MSDSITDLLNYGVPYIQEADGNTPLQRAVKMNDRTVIDSFVKHFQNDTNDLDFNDLRLIIKRFK